VGAKKAAQTNITPIVRRSNPFAPEEIERVHRRLATEHHPDRAGGNDELMARINRARDQGLEAQRAKIRRRSLGQHAIHSRADTDYAWVFLTARKRLLTIQLENGHSLLVPSA
jgi:hypothetical protein